MKNIILMVVIIFYLNLSATIINIPDDYLTIQEGINASVNSDTVLVQPGIYFENINYDGKNITVASLFLTTQNTAYILDTIINGNNNNWRLVTFENEETEEAKLIGFTIKNGYCRYSYREDAVGVGIYIINSSPSIENNIIEDNNCDWYQNGGGIGIQNSSAKIKNNIIRNNYGAYWGGGIYVYQSEGVLIENNIIYNHITQSGYGVAYGAGICINQSNNILTINNIIYNNTVDYGGGGGVAFHESSSDLINVIITDNSAGFGGGIFCYNSNLTMKNTTITDNSADWNGGGIRYDTNSTSVLINCILWNNSPHEIYFDDYGLMSTVTISYSDIQGGEAGIVTNNNGTVNWLEGNIEEDPLFAGTGEDPYSLMEDSPCIDTGTPDTTGLNLPLCDIIGNLRIWDGDEDGIAIIDMGAYEYGAPPYVDVEHNLIVEVPGLIFKQNYPNPFNPETTINYQLPKNSEVELIICNIKGQRVKVLVNDFQDTGEHSIIWNGVDESGKPVSSGIYFYKLNVNGKIEAVRKCLLLK